jgi:hypothetical protein
VSISTQRWRWRFNRRSGRLSSIVSLRVRPAHALTAMTASACRSAAATCVDQRRKGTS